MKKAILVALSMVAVALTACQKDSGSGNATGTCAYNSGYNNNILNTGYNNGFNNGLNGGYNNNYGNSPYVMNGNQCIDQRTGKVTGTQMCQTGNNAAYYGGNTGYNGFGGSNCYGYNGYNSGYNNFGYNNFGYGNQFRTDSQCMNVQLANQQPGIYYKYTYFSGTGQALCVQYTTGVNANYTYGQMVPGYYYDYGQSAWLGAQFRFGIWF